MLAGQVIAAYGRHYLVEAGDGRHYACFPRGKKSTVACGDRVLFAQTADEQGVIEAVCFSAVKGQKNQGNSPSRAFWRTRWYMKTM